MENMQSITEQWKEVKNLFESKTNGNHDFRTNYGENFKIGGRLEILVNALLGRLAGLTNQYESGSTEQDLLYFCKEEVWLIFEKAGLLEPLPKDAKPAVKKAS
jgi:hypothetical protein